MSTRYCKSTAEKHSPNRGAHGTPLRFAYLILFLIFLLLPTMVARSQGTPVTSATVQVPAPTPWSIISRSANARVWQRTAYEISPNGKVVPRTESYTELAAGLCYKQNGEWLDSKKLITILPDGTAAATNGQHQVYFPADIYSGAIKLVTPGGLKLISRPIGISYDDGSNTVLIAELTNSIGQLISQNQIIYTNAFVGVSADLLYTYRKGGFEQDVIFRAQPSTPEQFGMNSANTRLQMLTEFFNAPEPSQTPGAVDKRQGLRDMTLAFGAMRMGRGRAFLTGTSTPEGEVENVPIYKEWAKVNGRQVLVEESPFGDLSPQLGSLPAPAQVTSTGTILDKLSAKRLLPPLRLAKLTRKTIQIARLEMPKKPGFDFDYVAMDASDTNFTFQGDSTYFVSGPVSLYGTTVIEGGAVIKYVNVTNSSDASLLLNGPITCKTSSYNHAIFTAMDDDTVGETISGSTGSPGGYYAYPALSCQDPNDPLFLHDLVIKYSFNGLFLGSAPSIVLRDMQFLDNNLAIVSVAPQAYIENSLVANTAMNFVQCVSSSINAQNLTAVHCAGLWSDFVGPSSFTLTNSLLIAVTNLSPAFTGAYNATNSNDSGIFQTVGAGSYYLATDSPYRAAGTPDIDPALLADLNEKTTWPPTVYSVTNISSLGTLGPDVPRDTNSSPDLGYHYDPLDYVFSGCDLYSNLTFTTGTAVGWYQAHGSAGSSGQPYAISLNNGASLSFNGDATQPCYFANYAGVQEGGNGNWTTRSWMGGIMFNGSDTNQEPLLSADFTKWTSEPNNDNIFRDNPAYGAGNFRNCEFYDCQFATYEMQNLCFTNCLFFRNCITFYDQSYALSFAFENCTFYNGGLFYGRYSYDMGDSSSFWLMENCSFDGTAFNWADNLNGNSANTLFNYNAYNTNNIGWQGYSEFAHTFGTNEIVGPNDVKVGSYDWEPSWFGDFYLPTNSPLIYQGSTNAGVVGLYHFTTLTNQIPDGTNIVTIGYHYVATDQYGNPLDSNGDGIPDYLEDPSGRGILGPQITLITPVTGSFYIEPATIPIQATVSDWSGIVTNVEFLQSNGLQGAVGIFGIASSPYSYSWPVVAAGQYGVNGVAEDSSGLSATSMVVSVTVTNLCGY